VATLAVFATTPACQRVLGIHGSQLGKDGGGAGGHPGATDGGSDADAVDGASLDVAGPGDGGEDAAQSEAGGGGGPGSGGMEDTGGRSAGSGGTGSGGMGSGGADTGGRGGGGGAGGSGPVDAGPKDGNSGDTSSDGGSDATPADARPADAGGADAGMCAAPWHAEGVDARLFDPSTITTTACSLAGSAVPTLAAAVDAANFRGAQACGACLRVQASLSTASVVVPVVEKSNASGVLLTKAAMDVIATGASLTKVDWSLVPCDVKDQPVRYYIKEGSNAGYVGVQVRNARYPIAAVAAVGSSTSLSLALQPYNYWESTMAGAGPLTLRLTDINGQTIQDSGIKITPQTETTGTSQLPLCR
jgi:expansin (peptidoglycan-binding protein)